MLTISNEFRCSLSAFPKKYFPLFRIDFDSPREFDLVDVNCISIEKNVFDAKTYADNAHTVTNDF